MRALHPFDRSGSWQLTLTDADFKELDIDMQTPLRTKNQPLQRPHLGKINMTEPHPGPLLSQL